MKGAVQWINQVQVQREVFPEVEDMKKTAEKMNSPAHKV